MCGIALIISGIRLELSSLCCDSTQYNLKSEQLEFDIDDIDTALSKRGPDSIGSKKLFLQPNSSEKWNILSFIEGHEAIQNIEHLDCISLENGQTSDGQRAFCVDSKCSALFHFIGATLQLRGTRPVVQPFMDGYKNILVYNGEIFGGLLVQSDENDGEVLMQTLEKCCSCKSHLHKNECFSDERGPVSVIDVLSNIKGPWAMVYWQDNTRTLWFGRDAFGRRSLLVHWPTFEDSRLLLSSVSPVPSVEQSSDFEDENSVNLKFWEELPCGIYSITLDAQNHDGILVGNVQRHGWSNAMLVELVKWERTQVEPSSEQLYGSQSNTFRRPHGMQSALLEPLPIESGSVQTPVSMPALNVLNALRESVRRRSSFHSIFQANICHGEKELAPIAVLFSGGLDSMILAALLHECVDLRYEIDLLNVSFDGQLAPDRITAKAGVKELRQIAPMRKWKLVEIDSHLSNLKCEMKHVMSLINPANTYMDLNIGIALWLASGGDGWLHEEHSNLYCGDYRCIKYKSRAKILLVGSGADEQCAGYGRHRTKYRNGRWLGLHEEMKLDIQRIWKRNLGRDDRCIADNGKEARFPFLDEDVIKVLLDIPLWEVADLNQPSGAGDKKILREVAQLLGLYAAAALPKRAIQFGSRIARESNRKKFGSNRAANQASAGSVVIDIKSSLL